MESDEDIRFHTHELLLRLDAATIELMKLVGLGLIASPLWNEAVIKQRTAFKALHEALEDIPATQTGDVPHLAIVPLPDIDR
jgi:hypothetical protein